METALYAPVKAFLERHGFVVKGEVRGCDIVAQRVGDDVAQRVGDGVAERVGDVVAQREGEPPLLVIAELKLGLTLDLLLQAIDRMAIADEVWLAVPATRRGRDQDRRAQKLCRMLGIGLLTVTMKTGEVAVLVEPAPYTPRANLRKRDLLRREFNRRQGDPTPGGGRGKPIMTAYRQTALALAATLRDGPRRPRDLRDVAKDAGTILYRNVYGWFDRPATGQYALTQAGVAALAAWLADGPQPR